MRTINLLLASLIILASSTYAFAGGPLYVGGKADVQGQPYRWNNSTPVTYKTDLGALGLLTKEQADQFTADCFAVWQNVPSANIAFSKSGNLSVDVTTSNFLSLANDPNSELNKNTVILYDTNGSLTDALYGSGASTHILGFASITDGASDGTNNYFRTGLAVLNGKFIDGVNYPEVSLDKFKEAFIHEFGHLAGLDHSQINVEALDYPSLRDADRLAGLPTMFPILLDTTPRPSLAPDDIAAISRLYPRPSFATSTGTIKGNVLFSDGRTPAQGVNVIARMIDNPGTTENESRRIAVSSVSGFLFTADNGNVITGYPGSAFGSRNTSHIGYYELSGLPPGTYTVEVESIDSRFVAGSGVGPLGSLGIQIRLPGTCQKEYLNLSPVESATDSCSDFSNIVVTPGDVIGAGTDIILNGTPPGTDAWESDSTWSNDPLINLETPGSEVLA